MKQFEQLKLNVTNIHSFLVKSNKEQKNKIKKSKEIQKRKLSIENNKKREKKIEVKSFAAKSPLKNPQSSIVPGGSVLDNILNFGALVLAGILVNGLPNIIEEVKETFTAISEFLSPIVTAFQMLIDFTGGGSNPELEGPKAQLLSDLQNVKDGAMVQLKQKLGILGGVVDLLEPLIDGAISKFGSKLGASGTQLVKKDGKEGFQSGDGNFVETKWTSEQRKRFESGDTRAFIVPKSSSVGGSFKPATPTEEQTSQSKPSTGPVDAAHGGGLGSSQSKVGFEAGNRDTSTRIFLHWSAGSHTQAYGAYHSIALGDGTIVRNKSYGEDKYTHTKKGNNNSVGLAIAAASGAQERGKLGQYAPTDKQLDAMIFEAAKLALKWGWSESTVDSNVRTHGEWERYATRNGILPGSPQRWDLDRLRDSHPFIDTSKVLSAGGNELRERIKATLRLLKEQKTSSTSETKIRPVSDNENQKVSFDLINQPDPRKKSNSTTVALQPVYTVQTAYVPMPVPMIHRSGSSTLPTELSQIWV